MAVVLRKPDRVVTVEDILSGLRRYRLGDEIMVPNICAPWECDFLSITRAGYAWEFEIKMSRSDFLADFKKEKHGLFSNGKSEFRHPWFGANDNGLEIPCRFWFATAPGIVTISDIPEYAGWLEADMWGYMQERKKAPQIHRVKVSDQYKIKALKSMMERFWQMRAKVRNQEMGY